MHGRRSNKGPIRKIESMTWFHDTPGGRSRCAADEPSTFPSLVFDSTELRDRAYAILWDCLAVNESTGESALSDDEPTTEHALVLGVGQVEPDDEEGQVEPPDDEPSDEEGQVEPDDDEGQVEPDDDELEPPDGLDGISFG